MDLHQVVTIMAVVAIAPIFPPKKRKMAEDCVYYIKSSTKFTGIKKELNWNFVNKLNRNAGLINDHDREKDREEQKSSDRASL